MNEKNPQNDKLASSTSVNPTGGSFNSTSVTPNMLQSSLILTISEMICSEMQLRFYYHSGDYISVVDLYRLLSKCTTTPDLMLRKLIEIGILETTDKPNIVRLK